MTVRAGQPLYHRTTPAGIYFNSVPLEGFNMVPEGVQEYPMIHESQPISHVQWISRDQIRPNSYNPNEQAPPEFRLLKVSILENGWTQPIVVHRESMCIVDGEHRWTVAGDPEIAALTGGMVPVVFLDGDLNQRMLATIRHNRARGVHGVLPMAEIVRDLLSGGMTKEDVMTLLQMEDEEVERLAERAGMPTIVARSHSAFNPGWVPEDK